MIALDRSAHEKMTLRSLDTKVTGQMTGFAAVAITHLGVEAFPSNVDDQRIMLLFSADSGVDPPIPTITFAMSAAGAQKIVDGLVLAIAEAQKGR